jgi:cell division protein FtsQ
VARSRRRAFFVRVGVLLVLVAIGWAAAFSPLLKIDSIEVSGARHTERGVVKDAAGVSDADNLLLVSTSDIEARIEELPWVESASVTRKLPGTIKVKVIEREPAIVLSIGAATWTLDKSGRVLEAGTVSDELAILGGVDVSDIEPGSTLSEPEVQSALKTWRGLPPGLRREVRALFAPTVERISLTLADGTIVRYGAAENIRAKNRVLSAVLDRLRSSGRTAAYIDVRVPTSPAIGPPALIPILPTEVAPAESTPDATERDQRDAAEADEPADGYTP